jgi:uncharacterized protein
MEFRSLLICSLLMSAEPAIANDAAPSDESIQQLLTLTNARQMIEQVKVQVDSMMAATMREAQQGQAVTPERQAVLDRMRTKMVALMNQTLNWENLQAIYVHTYRSSLTQDELDGIVMFYQSPAGQAYIKKMPLIMQNVMAEMQGIIKPMQQKMVEIQRETLQELKDLKASQGAS